MPLTTQAKVLRVLIDQVFQRVGGSRAVRVDVRIVSATSRDLRMEIAAGKFREDLYHRLNVVPIIIPSLVERREDIPELVSHFARRLSLARGRRVPAVSDEALAVLQAYDWPGNVRQLRNIIERTLIMTSDEDAHVISATVLPSDLNAPTSKLLGGDDASSVMSIPLREAREVFEREYLRVQIRRFSGNISRTAAFIGMERSALHRKMRSLGLTDFDRALSRSESGEELTDVESVQGG
jgi:two-component system, NtrC family, nitrogen regulation response regulator NtrX